MSERTGAERVALCLEYEGSRFAGWQSQRDPVRATVQETLETALSRVADAAVVTVCAGRTDAGVHASAQIVHFDTPVSRPDRAWVYGANALLPPGVSIQWATVVPGDFHARFSAEARTYRYLVQNRTQRSALTVGRCCHERHPLDAMAMDRAAQSLLGEHDFSAFRGAGCQAKTSMRRVERIAVRRVGEFVLIDITANAFLLHMVRNIVGSLLKVGRGEAAEDWLGLLLSMRDRRRAGVTAPPGGLYLAGVRYAEHWRLPPLPPAPSASVLPLPE